MKNNRRNTLKTLLAACAVALGATLLVNAKEAPPKKYTLKTCIVTDNKLGSMGKTYRFVYKGQEVKLCCKPCLKKFNKNPSTYLAKLNKKK